MNVKKYILSLIYDAHKWQYTDINGRERKPKLYFLSVQWLIILVSILFHIFAVHDGIDSDLAGYCIAALSIFVGLFLSLVITIFEKFNNIDFSQAITQTEKVNAVRTKNFFKQFSSLTSYSILLAILDLVLLGFSISDESFVVSIESVNNILYNNLEWYCVLINLAKPFFVLLYRITTTYFMLNFLYITIYAIVSIYDYMKSEYNKVKINK